jgi:methionyl-tRNA formyltransferase
MVISECKPADFMSTPGPMQNHFHLRGEVESDIFWYDQSFASPCLPIQYGELNNRAIIKSIGWYDPDLIVTFGCSIVKEQIISIVPPNKIVNLHLGVAPNYRGSGTNFWPWVFDDLGNVGATIMFLDKGIDTGNIISVVRPEIKDMDDVHSLGCRTIQAAGRELVQIIPEIYRGKIQGTPQADIPGSRFMRRADFDEKALATYLDNLKNGIVQRHLEKRPIEL